MLNRFDGIDLFLQVVESGSFARAAERLHLSRSAVGKGIARLESRLGVRLFQRTTRSQTLTAEGIFFLNTLNALMAKWNQHKRFWKAANRFYAGAYAFPCPCCLGVVAWRLY
jgi:DNA-binding transcriptional LysR family regulator